MNNWTLKQRLALLTLIPALALIVSVGKLILDSYQRYQGAAVSKQILLVQEGATQFMEAVQRERMIAVSMLNTDASMRPSNKAFKNVGQNTENKLQRFKQQLQKVDHQVLQRLRNNVAEIDEVMQVLDQLRQQVRYNRIDYHAASDVYSLLIRSIFKLMKEASGKNSNATISNQFLTYQTLSHIKENVELERVFSVPIYYHNQAEWSQLQQVLEKINKQAAYINTFYNTASTYEKQTLARLLEGDGVREIERMRNTLIRQGVAGGFDVDVQAWMKKNSLMSTGLSSVERLVAQNIHQSIDQLLKQSFSTLIWQVTMALLVVLMSVVLSVSVGRSVIGSLQNVVDAAEYVVKNRDFSRKVPESGTQETVRVGQAMNSLLAQFSAIIAESLKSSNNIANASRQLTQSSAEVNRSSTAQADAAATVAATIEQVSTSVSETSENARIASETVTQSQHKTDNALGVMAETVTNVNDIAELIREANSNVARLDSSSKRIGGIVQVIHELADQTNLLALNAAIEAARAGEQGRGFAVVADEVRKLAERTSSETTEITELINEIQKNIADSVSEMNRANEHVMGSLNLVNRTETAVRGIGDDSHGVAINVQSIVDAIAEQNTAIQQVAANIETIARMAEENSVAASSTSETAGTLDNLSNELKNSVARYRI